MWTCKKINQAVFLNGQGAMMNTPAFDANKIVHSALSLSFYRSTDVYAKVDLYGIVTPQEPVS